jgi:ribosomal-protein-serine acetyltransferase
MFTLKIESSLELVLVKPSFAKDYYTIVCAQRDYLGQWLAWPVHADSEEFFLLFVNKSIDDYTEGKSLTCAMVFEGEVVGNISFNTLSQALKKVEIGYWLSKDFQGKGIVTKSVLKFISYAFNQLDMEVVQISAAVGNTASRKVCDRLGFKLDGIIKNSENLNGRIVDHAVYSLNHEQWLKT